MHLFFPKIRQTRLEKAWYKAAKDGRVVGAANTTKGEKERDQGKHTLVVMGTERGTGIDGFLQQMK